MKDHQIPISHGFQNHFAQKAEMKNHFVRQQILLARLADQENLKSLKEGRDIRMTSRNHSKRKRIHQEKKNQNDLKGNLM